MEQKLSTESFICQLIVLAHSIASLWMRGIPLGIQGIIEAVPYNFKSMTDNGTRCRCISHKTIDGPISIGLSKELCNHIQYKLARALWATAQKQLLTGYTTSTPLL